MKLGEHILSEVLNQTISILLAQPKKHRIEIFQNAENLILPLPTDTAPAHPFRRGPQYFSDFFIGHYTVRFTKIHNLIH